MYLISTIDNSVSKLHAKLNRVSSIIEYIYIILLYYPIYRMIAMPNMQPNGKKKTKNCPIKKLSKFGATIDWKKKEWKRGQLDSVEIKCDVRKRG